MRQYPREPERPRHYVDDLDLQQVSRLCPLHVHGPRHRVHHTTVNSRHICQCRLRGYLPIQRVPGLQVYLLFRLDLQRWRNIRVPPVMDLLLFLPAPLRIVHLYSFHSCPSIPGLSVLPFPPPYGRLSWSPSPPLPVIPRPLFSVIPRPREESRTCPLTLVLTPRSQPPHPPSVIPVPRHGNPSPLLFPRGSFPEALFPVIPRPREESRTCPLTLVLTPPPHSPLA